MDQDLTATAATKPQHTLATDSTPSTSTGKPAAEQPKARPLPTETAARRRAMNVRGW
jgi:hypothetical protein